MAHFRKNGCHGSYTVSGTRDNPNRYPKGDAVPPTVTPADIKHRQEFKDVVIAHADAVYKPILRQLYGLWEAYTKELLKEPMVPPYIMAFV